MVERAQGLILRTRPLTDTSLIVHWLTPELGRIATVAKGARRSNSPFRGRLDLFYLADFSFSRSRRSDLHTLREVLLRQTHPLLRRELACLRQASYFAALIEQTTETDTPLPTIFPLLAGLLDALLDEVLGLGPLQALLEDPAITEIMINHPHQIYVERGGRVTLSPIVFESAGQLRQVIDRIVSTVGRRVDESSPMCDARLRDGSRVNVVLPPLALDGPCMTIRKFSRDKLRPDDLLTVGSASPAMIEFLRAAVRSRLSILVAGGTSSGKTTLLNILSSFIPSDERIVTVEDSAELQLRQKHVIRLESRPPNVEGKGVIEIRDLVRNALRMRPDRIIVGECRGGEALDMLQAMNTGHEGSMSTVHANSPYDAFGRLETMVLMGGADLPARAIQKQIASAIDIVVQAERVRGGARKIVSIAEITGLVNGETQLHELFQFRQSGVDAEGNAVGLHTATGNQSIHLDHFAERGETVSTNLFEPSALSGVAGG